MRRANLLAEGFLSVLNARGLLYDLLDLRRFVMAAGRGLVAANRPHRRENSRTRRRIYG